jgi:hypothetical protein
VPRPGRPDGRRHGAGTATGALARRRG